MGLEFDDSYESGEQVLNTEKAMQILERGFHLVNTQADLEVILETWILKHDSNKRYLEGLNMIMNKIEQKNTMFTNHCFNYIKHIDELFVFAANGFDCFVVTSVAAGVGSDARFKSTFLARFIMANKDVRLIFYYLYTADAAFLSSISGHSVFRTFPPRYVVYNVLEVYVRNRFYNGIIDCIYFLAIDHIIASPLCDSFSFTGMLTQIHSMIKSRATICVEFTSLFDVLISSFF